MLLFIVTARYVIGALVVLVAGLLAVAWKAWRAYRT